MEKGDCGVNECGFLVSGLSFVVESDRGNWILERSSRMGIWVKDRDRSFAMKGFRLQLTATRLLLLLLSSNITSKRELQYRRQTTSELMDGCLEKLLVSE